MLASSRCPLIVVLVIVVFVLVTGLMPIVVSAFLLVWIVRVCIVVARFIVVATIPVRLLLILVLVVLLIMVLIMLLILVLIVVALGMIILIVGVSGMWLVAVAIIIMTTLRMTRHDCEYDVLESPLKGVSDNSSKPMHDSAIQMEVAQSLPVSRAIKNKPRLTLKTTHGNEGY